MISYDHDITQRLPRSHHTVGTGVVTVILIITKFISLGLYPTCITQRHTSLQNFSQECLMASRRHLTKAHHSSWFINKPSAEKSRSPEPTGEEVSP